MNNPGSKGNVASTYSGSSTDDELPAKPRSRSTGKALVDSDLSDDSEFTEKGTEVCQLGEEICAVPAELFDLPDLKKILSLETWNTCLTEEEREGLCAFLPDLDEGSFKTTLKQLFAGNNFHFGSPLQELLDRMKGGLCQPRVARYREGLKYLQRKEHYHNLRSYHNRMVNTFLDMQKIWDNCPEAEVDERLEVWRSWKLQRQLPQRLLDKKLPASKKPETPKRFKVGAKPLQPARKGKGKVSEQIQEAKLPETGGSGGQRAGSKGVLKVRAPTTNEPPQGSGRVYKPTPKGVLKVASRGLLKGNLKEKGYSIQLKVESSGRTDYDIAASRDPSPVAVKEEVVEVKKPRSRTSGEKRKRSVPAEPSKRKKQVLVIGPALESDKEKRESYKNLPELMTADEERVIDSGREVEPEFEDDDGEDDREHEWEDPEELRDVDLCLENEDPRGEQKPEKRKVNRKGQSAGELKKPRVKVGQEVGDSGDKPKKAYVRKKPGERTAKDLKAVKKGKAVKEEEEARFDFNSIKEGDAGIEEEPLKDEEVAEGDVMLGSDVKEGESSKKKKKASKKKKPPPAFENELVDEGKEVAEVEGANEQNLDSETYFANQDEVKANKKRPSKKKPKGEKDQTLAPESSPNAGTLKEKTTPGPSAKASKKPTPPPAPTLASTFPFSIVHLLSAVRVALLLPYQQEPLFHVAGNGEPRDGAKQVFNLNVPPMIPADGPCLVDHAQATLYCEQSEQASTRFAHQGEQPSNGFFSPQVVDAPLSAYPDREQDVLDRSSDLMDMEPDRNESESPAVPFAEIVRRVQANSGDPRMFIVEDPLQILVRGSLKVLSSRAAPQGVKGWKPLAVFDKKRRGWCWVGPLPSVLLIEAPTEIPTTAEDWGISQKTLVKMEDMLASWLKHGHDILRRFVQGPMPPAPPITPMVDERERFRDFKVQKSLVTIAPTSDDMKVYFHREELIRYLLPDRPFAYTRSDGCKAVVAPLRRGGGKPTSKARDHFMLKPDRPPHVTILCLVRDAAARLPGSIGTRADVCALIRDSQFIMEEVSDAQINQVVSGALDRLHYERDPCVRFDGDRKLWVYLHTERDEEDFEDDGTSSTKRWKKPKKDGGENTDPGLNFDNGSPCGGEIDTTGNSLGGDVHSPDGLGENGEPSSIYCMGGTELVYNKSGTLASPRVLGPAMNVAARDEMLPFMELPPSIRPPPLNLQPMHHMPWDSTFTSDTTWDGHHLHSHEHLREFEYDVEAQRAADAMFDVDTD